MAARHLRQASTRQRLALVAIGVISLVATSVAAREALSPGSGCNAGVNAALHRPAIASSVEADGFAAANAVDGEVSSRWSSAFNDPQWLQIDLGTAATVCRVIVSWAPAYAKSYQVQLSDGMQWINVYETRSGDGATDIIGVNGAGRYVRVYGEAGGTDSGYSLTELVVNVAAMTEPTGSASTTENGSSTSSPSGESTPPSTPPAPSPSRAVPSPSATMHLPTPTLAGPTSQTASFTDPFDVFDNALWRCEYTCPTVSGGAARYAVNAGIAPNNYGSWSKSRYTPQRFTSGTFTVRFALTARPAQKVWWGVALWDDGLKSDGTEFNEINFGYTTNQSFTNSQLYFESAKPGNAAAIKVDTGVNLYDGSYHTAQLKYDSTQVSFYFDGNLMATITDPTVIPTDPMDLILGTRLVTGGSPLVTDFTESIDWIQIG